MSTEEQNKKYVRENVPSHLQSQFYDYFVQIQDHHLFHQWPIQRTISLVSSFNHSANHLQNHQQTKSHTQKEDSHSIGSSPKRQSPVSVPKLMRSASVGKKQSALNFLKDIEEKVLKSPSKNEKKIIERQWSNEKDNIWLNFQMMEGKEKKKYVFQKDPFENFDSCILSPSKKDKTEGQKDNKKKEVSKDEQVQKVENIPVSPPVALQKTERVKLKRSQQAKLSISTDLKRPKNDIRCQLKEKKNINFDKLFKQKLSEEIPCQKIKSTFQATKASISGHQIVHRTLLPDYAIYIITIHPSNSTCKRTYDNFVELRNVLSKNYPGIKVPSLDSGSWFSQSDIALINKNKASLQMFLNDLLDHPLLSKTEILGLFLSQKEQKVIEKSLEDLQDATQKSSLSQISNQKGFLKVSLSEESTKAIEQLPKWKKIYESYFQKYIDLIETLTSQFESVKGTYSQMVKMSSSFLTKISQLGELRISIPFEPMQQLLSKQMTYFDSHRNQLEKDVACLKQKYSSILKYFKLNVVSFEPMYSSVITLTQKYIKRLENEPQSPSSQLSTNGNSHKGRFSSDIWHQSQSMGVFKYQLGYLHSQLLQQCQIFNKKMISNMNYTWSQVFPQLSYHRLGK